MKRLVLATAALLALTASAQAQSQEKQAGNSAIGRSAAVYRSLSSLRADFVQLIANPMIDSMTSRGILSQAGAAKFAMHFSDPASDAVVIDGEHVWVYTPSTTPGQVIRMALPSGGPAYGYNILAWLLDRPTERYEAKLLRTERVNARSADVVELTPTVPDLPFSRAIVWLDREDGLPRRLEIHEKSGTIRTLTLSKVRVNERIPEKTFKLSLPQNTRVIDQ